MRWAKRTLETKYAARIEWEFNGENTNSTDKIEYKQEEQAMPWR